MKLKLEHQEVFILVRFFLCGLYVSKNKIVGEAMLALSLDKSEE